MATIKELLGDAYREGMTAEELDAAISGVDLQAGYVPKDAFNRVSSELAEMKRQLKSRMTEDEARKAQEDAEREAMKTELAELKRGKAVSENRAGLLALGYGEELAAKCAEAMTDGKTADVLHYQKLHLEQREQALRTEFLRETPRPSAGVSGGAAVDYQAKAAAASARGDMSAAAYYTRLGAQTT